MNDFFDSIEDDSFEKKEEFECGYKVFMLRLDIENPICELAYINWEKMLQFSIKNAIYKDIDIMNFSIMDLSEHKPKSEYKVYIRITIHFIRNVILIIFQK